MTKSYYVIFDRNGINRFAKTDAFDLKSGEYVVKMILNIPDALFKTPPMPEVNLTLTPNMLQRSLSANVGALLGDVEVAEFKELGNNDR